MHVEPPPDRAIFLEAIESVPPERWESFLKDRCAGDEQLVDRVRRLMAAHQRLGEFHEEPDLGHAFASEAVEAAPLASVGTRIGPYTLREQIGEGGMGVVYVADQAEPVRRKVALKIIKPGMATKDVVARFEAERQALAMMDHPNIARVLDGGATELGQPYFVMELVQGLPITEYCDARQLDTRQSLELFTKVCRAVHHAHQKGIIHRDLKPPNVLVPEIDGVAVPRVIDFGVAKAINQKLTEQTLYTNFLQMVGTPLYMSPEQAGLGVIDIDTRSDVYSLGVLLYELITGSTPFDRETLKSAGFDEMRRIIREDDPPRPSTKVDTLIAHTYSTFCQRRGIDPRALSKMLKGELDWLVMKAMEKDRNRRYESASDLAEDLDRYLRDDPVTARPMSPWYRAQKFTRRNRVLVASLAAVFIALSLGAALATVGFWHAIQQRNLAHENLIEAEDSRVATDEAFQLLWDISDSEWGKDTEAERLTVREAMARLEDGLAKRLQGRPKVEIRIRRLLASHYRRSGTNHAEARVHLNRALTLANEVFGAHSEDVANIYVELADELQWTWTDGRQPWIEPIDVNAFGRYARRALDIYEALGVRGRTSHAWFCLSLSLTEPHERKEAETCLRTALKIKDGPPKMSDKVFALLDLADFLSLGNETDIAESHKLYEEAMVEIDQLPGDKRTRKASIFRCRGRCYRRQGHEFPAIRDCESAWNIYRTDGNLKNELRGHNYAFDLAELYLVSNQPKEAARVLRQVEEIGLNWNLKKSLAEVHFFKGWTQFRQQAYVLAEEHFTEALAHAEEAYSEKHAMITFCHFYLADSFRRQGKNARARDYYRLVQRETQPWFEMERSPAVVLWMHATSLIHSEDKPGNRVLREAIAASDRAKRTADAWEKPQLYLVKANAKYKLGDVDTAVELLKQGLVAWEEPVPSLHDTRKGITTSRRELADTLARYEAETAAKENSVPDKASRDLQHEIRQTVDPPLRNH